MNLQDINSSLTFCNQSKELESALDESLFDKTINQLNESQLIKVRTYVTQLISQNKALQQAVEAKQSTIEKLERQLEEKTILIQMLDKAKKEIEQTVQKIVCYNQHYLQIIEQKDQEIEDLLVKESSKNSLEETEEICHYDIQADINTNLFQWDYINEKQKKGKRPMKFAEDKIFQENKPSSKKSILDDVKKYITDTQQKFKKLERSPSQQTKKHEYPRF